MTVATPANDGVEFTEDRAPHGGMEDNVAQLGELYGGEPTAAGTNARTFVLPLRRGVAVGGGVECTVSWVPEAETVRLTCERNVDAPRGQRVALLGAGVVGAWLFTMWPFFGKGSRLGAGACMAEA